MTPSDDPGLPQGWSPPAPPPPDPGTRQFAGYAAPQPAVPGPDLEPLAVAALVLGLASLVLFFVAFLPSFGAVVLGISALLRLRRRPERSGRAMAAIGIGAGLLSIPLAIVIFSVTDDGDDDFFRPITIPYAELTLGDCYQRPASVERRIEVVVCDREHDGQAIGSVEHPEAPGSPYPGRAALVGFADERCQEAFNRFVDLPEERDLLVTADLVPTEAMWESGSRHLVCSVTRGDRRPMTGSVTDNSFQVVPGGA